MINYLYVFIFALLLSLSIGNTIIKRFNSIGSKQVFREDGPQDHIVKKDGTPTLGGLIFLIPVIIVSLTSYVKYESLQTMDLLFSMFVCFSLATLGYMDDSLKIYKRDNSGLSGKYRLLIQLLISILIFFIYRGDHSPFEILWIFLVFSGSCNAFNLTDGIDGLLSSLSILTFMGLSFIFMITGKWDLLVVSSAFLGSLVAFLCFNSFPAKIFMGDTGSLAIGGAVAVLSLVANVEILLIFFAIIPILETMSVIIQVASCKFSKKFLNKDIRPFKMTPIHHHFEQCGWSETTIVYRFFSIQLIFVIAGTLIYIVFL